jgi:hypothetical protein
MEKGGIMTKTARIREGVREAMSRNAPGAGRNTALIKHNDKYGLSTAAGGSFRAKVMFHGPPPKKFW